MPDAVKAAHYIQQLDEARCDDNWDAVPELVRKVRKHAPERACLAQSATTEHAIIKASVKSTPDSTSTPSSLEAASHLPTLLTVIENETTHPQDRFQARVCAGWLHWVLREYSLALQRLPRSFDEDIPADSPVELSEWTKVCALKTAYLRANCLARDGQRKGALEAFETALPSLNTVWNATPGVPARQQIRYWAELFLTEYCMLASQATRDGEKSLSEGNCLSGFRTWARYWAGAAKGIAVWSEYYSALSEILQRDLAYPPSGVTVPVSNGETVSARAQLRAELKKVETIYQGLLFSETKFPRADEERAEVEDFVAKVMRNWTILNGRGWKEHDLGTGGRDSLSRGTLDTLYGAATKTYHSTAILRHLFTVHLAVAEFDLAFVAFDSWFELVKKGKARVEKTGHREPALDDNATVLETVSAAIAALCRYGGREAADKARKISEELEGLVKKYANLDTEGADPRDLVPPRSVALAWQSVGLANAQWARMTYESESRAIFQEKAIQCLRWSLSPEFGHVVDVRGVFALGVLYAEQRKLSVAIELVKTALLADKAVEEHEDLHNGPYWKERSLIPLWHLLALMLSARQDYVLAARACEGAIEQFKDPVVLFGGRDLNGGFRSEHLNEAAVEKAGGDGIVDEMDDFEKESILEIKMTQLAILELVEGPTVAVNASTELLTLFPRLFGDLGDTKLELTKVEPPKTMATMRSVRDSMFGGRAGKGHQPRQSVVTSRPQTTQSVATTTLTSETAIDPQSSRRSLRSGSLNGRSRNSLRKRDRSGSRQRAVSSGPPVPPLNGGKYQPTFEDPNGPQHFTLTSKSVAGTLRPETTNSSALSKRTDGPSEVGTVIGTLESFSPLLPFVQFSQEHSKRKRKGILVKVWLTIAGFYRRAGLLDDTQKAIAEAQKIVQSFEGDVVSDTSGALNTRTAGWGMEKSVEAVLADVWTEKGQLSLALERPYQARADFETALTHFPDHPVAIVGLSNILLDIYSEKLLPPPAVSGLDLGGASLTSDSHEEHTHHHHQNVAPPSRYPDLPSEPLGLGSTKKKPSKKLDHAAVFDEETNGASQRTATSPSRLLGPQLPPPYKATSLPLIDRLAARDRAYGLLSGLTKLGSGWNYSEAWFALARAYEESEQLDKARDALWWVVELEDGMGVREWGVVASGVSQQRSTAKMRELTLILASTPKMGIGLSGTLPWPTLKKEMAYFARVTKRSPAPSVQNAVIMGRKTWDSIPVKFRPLPNRVNIVVSRSINMNSIEKKEDKSLWAGSLEKALECVDGKEGEVGRVFVIGGAEVYRAALGLRETKRVLLTRVDREWECDAFFPLELSEEEKGWRRVGQEEMDRWVGEEVPRGRQVEREGTGEETGYEFEMWERVD
ncbi:hypothetical protein B0T21DRAFT_380459 [Apiosordaria backusii]|uniref:dihydrofolate reductase n=1 Tax=Apiosordaria backusii TaxID=314023 RepID=A0AA40F079_9PEZI|nr:hypothetical protein B0T21DRAFT_380459 [Apiosordaria backusii]